MTILWQSDCCAAPLDGYRETECPECGEPCRPIATDLDAPNDSAPQEPPHRGRKENDR